mgnify:FL=1
MGIVQKGQVEYDDELHVKHELIKIVLYIIGIVGIVFLIHTFIGSRSEVVGHSMEDTLHDGESVWLDKLSYRLHEPERYDIVVFPVEDSETYFIKRIIGLPGETVYIDGNGDVYIGTAETLYEDTDGILHNEAEKLSEDYGKSTIQESMRGIAARPVTLGENEYFVMGDNRNNSKDSRSEEIGPITGDRIQGKAVFRLWPWKKFGQID